MSRKPTEFQPGAILHEVIVGAFRARGLTFEGWAKENGISSTNARQCTYGQSRGETGQRNLDRIINAAGREFVRDAYRRRLREHMALLDRGAA